MGNMDAKEKYFEAFNVFRVTEEKARARTIDANKFQMVIIDLEAAIPGLDGIMLGRALLLKACCLHWLHLDKIRKYKTIFDACTTPPDPLLKEGFSCALRGREILEKLRSTVDLPWANDIVNKLKDYE